MDEKKCPSCAEMVKAEAARCRFCGHEFVGGFVRRVDQAVDGASAGFGTTILIVIGLGLAVAFCGKKSSDNAIDPAIEAGQERSDLISSRANALGVTANELYQAYEANEAAAQAQYGNQVLEVSGVVESIVLNFRDEPVIHLATSNPFYSATVDLVEADKSRAAALQKGQHLIVICQGVSEMIGSPSLKGCAIVD